MTVTGEQLRIGEAVHIGTYEAGSPEWVEARREAVNGSEIAAILGLSPFESRFSLWHRKAGTIADEVEQQPQMYWGNRLESVVRDEFNQRHGRDFRPLGLFRHHERTWQGGGPDGIDVENGELLEVKTSPFGEGWGPDGTDEIPVYYRAQCLWYLDVFGFEVCHVAVLISGYDYREYRVTYSPSEIEVMRAAAREFLDDLEAGRMPPIDSHEATYQTVRELHPEIEPVTVELPDEVAEQYITACAREQDARAKKREAAARVLVAMGSAQRAYYQGLLIATRQAKSSESAPYLVAANGLAKKFTALNSRKDN